MHFTPEGMKRLQAYEKHLVARIRKHELTDEEALALLQSRVRAEAFGTAPTKVRCPDCRKAHRIVGKGQTFTCCTARIHSVWDCRLT